MPVGPITLSAKVSAPGGLARGVGMVSLESRQALPRAKFFLDKAEKCDANHRVDFEAFLDASIIFARSAVHRVESRFKKKRGWKTFWDSKRGDTAVEFFRKERNHILKKGPSKIGQIINLGGTLPLAKTFYYYEDPHTPATDTVRQHIDSIEKNFVLEAEKLFGPRSK